MWLNKIKSIHSEAMAFDLLRVKQVAEQLKVLKPNYLVVTVAGTNGKGSTVAGLEAVYVESGYKVGTFTSPFLFSFNEQIRLSGFAVSEDLICSAFEKIDLARKTITLTLFEFTALAALVIFCDAQLDIAILEVGLGGRLDAVNIIDADISVISSIDLDHVDILGNTREKIALEKAGIFRSGHAAVCGDVNPPQTLFDEAKKLNVKLYCQNKQYGFKENGLTWDWWSEESRIENFPSTPLLLINMATVLMVVELLQLRLSVSRLTIENAFKNVRLSGRIQVLPGDVTVIYDVSHNPAAITMLANYLQDHPVVGKTYAVFSMLKDKDIAQTLLVIKNKIDEWYVGPLQCERATTLDRLTQYFLGAGIENVLWFNSILEANKAVKKQAHFGDRVVIFGSFHTIAEAVRSSKDIATLKARA